MQCIGDRARNGRAGLGLVTVKRTRGYPTRTEVFLTDKGRAVAARVSEFETSDSSSASAVALFVPDEAAPT
jgi:hypothetical protein